MPTRRHARVLSSGIQVSSALGSRQQHAGTTLARRHARVLSPYPPLRGGGALGVSGIQVDDQRNLLIGSVDSHTLHKRDEEHIRLSVVDSLLRYHTSMAVMG